MRLTKKATPHCWRSLYLGAIKNGYEADGRDGAFRLAQKFATAEGFQLKRVRSGVETLLAQRGVSQEITRTPTKPRRHWRAIEALQRAKLLA